MVRKYLIQYLKDFLWSNRCLIFRYVFILILEAPNQLYSERNNIGNKMKEEKLNNII